MTYPGDVRHLRTARDASEAGLRLASVVRAQHTRQGGRHARLHGRRLGSLLLHIRTTEQGLPALAVQGTASNLLSFEEFEGMTPTALTCVDFPRTWTRATQGRNSCR
jgi:hypothetical protein